MILQELNKTFGDNTILQNCTYQFEPSKIHIIIGPSGSGKTTLLRVLGDLETLDSGRVTMDPETTFSWVFQESRLIPWLNLKGNILLSPSAKKGNPLQFTTLVDQFGLKQCLDLFPHQASGGMKSRTSILRSLMTPAKVYLWDEPFVGLDEKLKSALLPYLKSLLHGTKATVLINLHDSSDARLLGDFIHVLNQGRLSPLEDEV